MSALFEKRCVEWAIWFHATKDNGMSIEKRLAFMQQTIDGLLECLAIAAKDIQTLEKRNGNAELADMLGRLKRDGEIKIALPTGLNLHKPLRNS